MVDFEVRSCGHSYHYKVVLATYIDEPVIRVIRICPEDNVLKLPVAHISLSLVYMANSLGRNWEGSTQFAVLCIASNEVVT